MRRTVFSLFAAFSFDRLSVVVGIDGFALEPEEEARVLHRRHRLIVARLLKRKELRQIRGCPGIGKAELAFAQVVDAFNHAQHAAEVVLSIADETSRRIRRNHQQRNSKSILVIALAARRSARQLRNKWRRLIVRPSAPIVPRDYDGRVLPEGLTRVPGTVGTF